MSFIKQKSSTIIISHRGESMFGYEKKIQNLEEQLRKEGYWIEINDDKELRIYTPSRNDFLIKNFAERYAMREKDYQ